MIPSVCSTSFYFLLFFCGSEIEFVTLLFKLLFVYARSDMQTSESSIHLYIVFAITPLSCPPSRIFSPPFSRLQRLIVWCLPLIPPVLRHRVFSCFTFVFLRFLFMLRKYTASGGRVFSFYLSFKLFFSPLCVSDNKIMET